jgi:PhnB protein
MQVQPYLFFDGRCEEALDFYAKTLGAKIGMLMRFSDSPEPGMIPPGQERKIMHGTLQIGQSVLMVSDGRCGSAPKFEGISMSLTVADASEADRVFAGLSDGGKVQMPLTKTFFSDRFGMVADRFGVSWMILVEQPAAKASPKASPAAEPKAKSRQPTPAKKR